VNTSPNLVATWSFWSPPFQDAHRKRWLDDQFHLLSWVLSVTTVARHFPVCELVTDSPGARLLVDELGLPFTGVSTALDALNPRNREWWVLGKLRAYREQTQPFLHFDSDVYLWSALPQALMAADIIVQNPEPAPTDDRTYYKPRQIAEAFAKHGGQLPGFVRNHMECASIAFCAGVFGGSALGVIHSYAEEAERLVYSPRNRRAWATLGDARTHSVYVEQYILAARVAHEHCRRPALNVAPLFANQSDAFNEASARRMGYTHLIGDAKRNPILRDLVAAKAQVVAPDLYERACSISPDRHRQRAVLNVATTT
jgi:hypothetical protein